MTLRPTTVFCAALALFLALSGAAAAAAAADAPKPGDSLAQRYEKARKALEEQRAHENETRQTRDRLRDEAQSLREKLVANAARVQALEAASAATAKTLDRLYTEEAGLTADLTRNRAKVARLLAVLQRLDADEPPAIVMRPDDSLAAARGAMLLGATLPPVYAQAHRLGERLRALAATRAALRQKNEQARTEAADLAKARADLSALLQQRREEASSADSKLGALHDLSVEAARQTGDLKSLIDRIAALRAQDDPSHGMVVVTAKNGAGHGLERGSLRQPVVGIAVPGDPAGPGRTPGRTGPQGLWYETAGAAQAVAPGDSEVVFAGPYQKFGQVLLLEMAGGYHLLLAGLARVDVNIGDRVLAGEPVGVLPGGKAARLYFELRRNGRTVDPAPWMSVALRKARG